MDLLPLDGRVGHVAGIESLTVDGRRYYFGFDYGSDLVVSPLVDDPAAMAAFAARHLAQTDGPHDEQYWADLVAYADSGSALTGDPALAAFDSAGLRAESPGYHLRYLLGAASGWDDSLFEDAEVVAALRRLGLDPDGDWNAVDRCLDLTGPDAELVVGRYLAHLAAAVPGNWRTVFAPLLDRA